MREQKGIFDAVLYKKIINQTDLFHKLVTFTIVHSAELLSETPVYCLLN